MEISIENNTEFYDMFANLPFFRRVYPANQSTLDYLIAVGYQINVALGIFPEINKRSLLNNRSLGIISRN